MARIQTQANSLTSPRQTRETTCICNRSVRNLSRTIVAVITIVMFSGSAFCQSQNAAAVINAEGSFLRGLGSYNLNTARADSINTDTVIRWKEDLRRIENERRDLQARKLAGKKIKIEEAKEQLRQQEIKLRLDPSPDDIRSGQALNALLFDLTDPDIKSDDWASKIVKLPDGASVKNLIFRFTPSGSSSNASKALSKGVIALSMLDIEGKWPTAMKQKELDAERRSYETAYASLRNQLQTDTFNVKSLEQLDNSLRALKAKVATAVTKERGYRDEALKFVDDLTNATRFFDAATIDYAKEILVDTQDHDATTVGELVGFMLKYRLQFASAERSATGRVLYGQLYEAMQQQIKSLGIKPPELSAKTGDPAQPQNGSIADEQKEARKSADRKLQAAFDKQIALIRKNTQWTAAERHEKAKFLTAEKLTFEEQGTIPFSPHMRVHVLAYLKTLAEADARVAKAYDEIIERLTRSKDQAAAAEKRTEKEAALEPRIVGSWKITRLDNKDEYSWTFYSNGKVGESGTWTLDEASLVAKFPGPRAPGGVWVDTCIFAEDGQSFSMTDQTGKHFTGVRVKQKD